jgi:hypothetical protein
MFTSTMFVDSAAEAMVEIHAGCAAMRIRCQADSEISGTGALPT